MSDKIDRSLIRNLVREVISEVVAGEEKAGPGQPKSSRAARKPVVEEVTISSDADLSRFVKHLLALSKNTETWLAVEEGARKFRYKGGVTDVVKGATRSTPTGKVERVEKGVVSETRIVVLAKEGVSRIELGRSAVLTPLGRDKARHLNIIVERENR
jgi:hypothetical protein